ncbi:MAG: hypothetical protein FJ031_08545 [Chloroflexi bacterium]|nr:hypothetical protein [Chloroflexota bacterium]
MKLPNASQAILEIEKLRDYCLSETHPRGKHKARVFAATLGITSEHAEDLRGLILQAIQREEAELDERDEYGQRYIVDVRIRYSGNEATVRTTWIIRSSENNPRLTSCYVL